MPRRWRQQVGPKPPRSSSETTARDGETNLRSFNRPGRFRNMAGKVKVGIIGSRFEADIHAAAFQIMPDEAEVVAVASPTPGNPEALAQKYATAKNGARTEQGCFVFCRLALNTTRRSPRTTRRSIQCPTAGQPTPTSDSGNLTCWTGIAPLAGA